MLRESITSKFGRIRMSKFDRRGFIKLAGLGGGIVFASSLSRGLGLNALGSVVDYANAKVGNDFYFVQLSDTHWGFAGPKVNPDAEGTLKKAVQAVNSLEVQPDFIVFTGDLTHTTDDVQVRKDRTSQFKDIVGGLKVPTAVRFVSRLGLVNEGRRRSNRCLNAAQECNRVLRPHPPGEPPHDGTHSPSLGKVFDVSVAGARLGAKESARTLGCERAL